MIDGVIDAWWILEINGFHFHFFSLPPLLEDLTENEMDKMAGGVRARKEKVNLSTGWASWIICNGLLRRAQKTLSVVPSYRLSSSSPTYKSQKDPESVALMSHAGRQCQWTALQNSQSFRLVTSKINWNILHMKMLNERTLFRY